METFFVTGTENGDISFPILPGTEPKVGDKIFVSFEDEIGAVYYVESVVGNTVNLSRHGHFESNGVETSDLDYQERAARDI